MRSGLVMHFDAYTYSWKRYATKRLQFLLVAFSLSGSHLFCSCVRLSEVRQVD